MFRKSLLALAAVAAVGVAALATAPEAAAKKGGWHKGGISIGIGFGPSYGYGYRYRTWAPRVTYYAPAYDECFKVVNRRGKVKIVCRY